jgi:hypothetical protein
MISLYLADAIVSFNWHFLDVDIHGCCVLSKLFGCEVLAGITNNNVGGALIYINPTDPQCVPSGLCTHILKKFGCLECGCFVDNMEDWFTIEIHDINDNTPVEFVVVLKSEFESAGGLAIHLALVAVFCEVFNSSLFDLVARSLQDSNETTYGWVTESAM